VDPYLSSIFKVQELKLKPMHMAFRLFKRFFDCIISIDFTSVKIFASSFLDYAIWRFAFYKTAAGLRIKCYGADCTTGPHCVASESESAHDLVEWWLLKVSDTWVTASMSSTSSLSQMIITPCEVRWRLSILMYWLKSLSYTKLKCGYSTHVHTSNSISDTPLSHNFYCCNSLLALTTVISLTIQQQGIRNIIFNLLIQIFSPWCAVILYQEYRIQAERNRNFSPADKIFMGQLLGNAGISLRWHCEIHNCNTRLDHSQQLLHQEWQHTFFTTP